MVSTSTIITDSKLLIDSMRDDGMYAYVPIPVPCHSKSTDYSWAGSIKVYFMHEMKKGRGGYNSFFPAAGFWCYRDQLDKPPNSRNRSRSIWVTSVTL